MSSMNRALRHKNVKQVAQPLSCCFLWLPCVHMLHLMHAQVHKVPVQELAVRFNCAMQDLQLLGFIKEAGRRRRDNCVQRLVFPMRS